MNILLHKRNLVISAIVLIGIVVAAQAAFAAGPVTLEGNLFCNGNNAAAAFTAADWPVQVVYTVVPLDGATTVISGTYSGPAGWSFDGPATFYIGFKELGGDLETLQLSVTCPDPASPVPAVTDDRVNASDTYDAHAAFYMDWGNADAAKNGIFVYAFANVAIGNGETETQGQLKAGVSAATLAKQPDKPAENTLLAASADQYYQIWKLTTGEYQINIGPDENGLVRVWIWKGVPPKAGSMYRSDFYIK